MADLASAPKEEPGGLPPAPAWGSGPSSYDGVDEPFALDSILAVPTLETVDDLLKELPCDGSAPDFPVVQPEPNRLPMGRLAAALGVGALLGALALGGALLLWNPETPTTTEPEEAKPVAAGVVSPPPLPAPQVPEPRPAPNTVAAPKVPSAEAPTPAEIETDTKPKRAPTASENGPRGGKHAQAKNAGEDVSVSDEAAPSEQDPAPLVPSLPSLDELEADPAPPSPAQGASELPQKPEPPSPADVPAPSDTESPTAQLPDASPTL